MSIFKSNPTPELISKINEMNQNTLISHLGIVFTAIGDNYVEGKMPVNNHTKQPFGLLHGGASVVLAETLGSVGSNMIIDLNTHYSVGLEINANHIKSAKTGFVYGKANVIHIGKKTHIWEIKITNEDNKLVCASRLTVAVIEKGR